MIRHKNEIKFVFNFHSAGKMWFIPMSGLFPNNLEEKHPKMYQAFNEIAREANFA
jgi:hypothetical protein